MGGGRCRSTSWLAASGFLVVALSAGRAEALQPLREFLSAARTHAFDNREATELAVQRADQADQQWAKLLPSLTAQGALTRNEYPASLTLPGERGAPGRTVVITPENQRDATFTAQLTLLDLAQLDRIASSEATAEGQRARAKATELDVAKTVARTYYQLVGAAALVASAESSLAAAIENRDIVARRNDAGVASTLDLDRAVAQVEESRQAIAEAELTRVLAVRAMSTLAGITPSDGYPALIEDLHEEPSLEAWESPDIGKLPSVAAAAYDSEAARKTAAATKEALLPTVAASATERFTNAAGFGTSPYYMIAATLTWKLDPYSVYGIRSDAAGYAVARVREDRAWQAARDAIHESWQTVRADIAKARSARSQLAASSEAAKLAGQRYVAGTATQLEVVQAQRDAFTADVSRIQADADLLNARAALRLSAGRSPLASAEAP